MELFLPSFSQGLAETGYVVGRNVTIESRDGDNLPALAADLVRRHVTVIVAMGADAALAAKAATQTIPVVFFMGNDPVEVGMVANLNRPSGNLTGGTSVAAELTGKRLEVMHQMVRRIKEAGDAQDRPGVRLPGAEAVCSGVSDSRTCWSVRPFPVGSRWYSKSTECKSRF
jgi:ABC-type uncharacterized transport system substrate-binding protein